jgi:2-haloacid dehalogenase
VADAQIDNSGLRDYFEQVLSADAVQRLKPAPEPYRMAAGSLGVEIGQVRLVAAHAWDVAGANLREVADQIIEIEAVRGGV